MTDETFVLSRPTAEALQVLLGQTPGMTQPPPARGGYKARHTLLVKCTSATAIGGGGIGDEAYPAVVLAGDGTEEAADQPELGDVWLTLLDTGPVAAVPTADGIYHAVLSGAFDPGSDERPRVFAAAPAAGGSVSGGMFTSNSISISADNTDTTASNGVSLAAGTYSVVATGEANATLSAATGAAISLETQITFRLWNDTDSTAITTYSRCASLFRPVVQCIDRGIIPVTFTIAGTKTVKFQGRRNVPYDTGAGQTWVASSLNTMILNYIKIA